MRVGHGVVELPVSDGTPLGGYADRVGTSNGRIDDLQVHALAFADSAGATFVLVACDVVCVNVDVVADCVSALRGVGFSESWIGATHTHSGPDTGCLPWGAPTPDPLRATLRDAVVSAAESAMSRMVPVTATAHPCVVSGVGGIRSLAPNVIDTPIDVVAFRGIDEQLLGALVLVPIHSTVLPAKNLALSADLVGGVRGYLEEATGTWAMVATGAAGDISTRHSRRDQSVAELMRLSEVVGRQVEKSLASPGRLVIGQDDRLVATRRVVSLPIAKLPDRRALGTRALVAMNETLSVLPRSRETLRQGLNLIGDLPLTGELGVELAVVGLGGLALCAIPGEPFLASAQQLRMLCRDSHPTTLVVGCTNGYRGYLPTLDRFDVATYEVLMSPFEAGAAETLIAELSDMVRDLRSTTPGPIPPRRPLDAGVTPGSAGPTAMSGDAAAGSAAEV